MFMSLLLVINKNNQKLYKENTKNAKNNAGQVLYLLMSKQEQPFLTHDFGWLDVLLMYEKNV